MPATYAIIDEACVACHACVRVCPTSAVVVEGDEVRIDQGLCIGCGMCDPACNHAAIAVEGEREGVERLLRSSYPVLILGTEVEIFFDPASFEQIYNACRELGFKQVYSSVLGDELVAREYLGIWESMNGRTVVRSTCPITVDYIRQRYPALLDLLAPVATPPAAAARYLRDAYESKAVRIAYAGPAGMAGPDGDGSVDATLTLGDLAAMLDERGIDVHAQPRSAPVLVPDRRRHLSVPGGMPLPVLAGERLNSVRVRKLRGLGEVGAVARAVADGDRLGFVDLTAWDGDLAHPSMGPTEELFLRRRVAAARSPGRAEKTVLDEGIGTDVSIHYRPANGAGNAADPEVVAEILEEIGTGPNGRPWNCGACGYPTCEQFARVAAVGRATLRMCPPAQERRAEVLARDAAYDALTGLYTYRVFEERFAAEVARVRRTRQTLSLIVMDLDDFKEVNDRFGHQTGNHVLQVVGDVIGESVRKSDLAARFGGDEFVVLLPETAEEGARVVAEKVLAGIAEVHLPEGDVPPIELGGSFGVASVTGRAGEDLDHTSFFEKADRALYEAKRRGGNTVVMAGRE